MLKLLGDRTDGPGRPGNRWRQVRELGRKPLGAKDSADVLEALDRDAVATCMVAARVAEHGLSPRTLGGELWSAGDPAQSLCFSGANLIPLLGDGDALMDFADRAASAPRMCSSLVGRSELVLPMWTELAQVWGPPREIRDHQPLMALTGEPLITPDPRVRQVTLSDLDCYLPAAVDMFVGEVGVDPRDGDDGRSYRRRIANLIAAGRAFAAIEDGEVIFKAEIGAMSPSVGQIQGVWVAPAHRGKGLGASGTAAVAAAITDLGRQPSLYVNSFNSAARAAYRAVGFVEIGSFATVLVD